MATSSGKRGRPQKEDAEKVSRQLVIKLNPEEYDLYLRLYKESGFKTRKDFFLKSIENAKTTSGIIKDRLNLLKELAVYRSDFAHIGSNINQVAHVVNIGGYAANDAEIANHLQKMNEYMQMVETKSNEILSLMGRFVKK